MEDEIRQEHSRVPLRMGRPRYEFAVDDNETTAGESAQSDFAETDLSTSKVRRPFLAEYPSRRMWLYRSIAALVALTMIVLLIWLVASFNGAGYSRDASPAAHTGATYESGFDMRQNWGSYSPYFDTGVPFEGVSKSALDGEYTLPRTCRYRQVHVLHRHGDRYPSGGSAKAMLRVAEKLGNMSEPPRDESLDWVTNWQYTLGGEQLVGGGVAAIFESGARFWGSHGRLLYGRENQTTWSDDVLAKLPDGSASPLPLIRAGNQQRIQDSARAWAAGFFGTYGYPATQGRAEDHYRLLLIPEDIVFNNSLAGYMGCPNSEAENANSGTARRRIWIDTYLADAAKRLQKTLPGFGNVTTDDALAIQDLCVFETAAYGQSAFCQLFTETEWRGFEYHSDLKFYGDSAHGSHVGPATGMGWLAELRARLRHELITKPGYGVNITLDGSSDTFPLDQAFYVDFTHDSVIASVLAAMQFSWTKSDLSPTKMQRPRQFIISRLTPFAAKLFVEVLECDDGHEYVRLKLNDRILPLDDFHKCPKNDDGLCSKVQFVESLEYALDQIDYDDVCFGPHKFKKYKA